MRGFSRSVRKPGKAGLRPGAAAAGGLDLEVVAGGKGALAGAGDDPDPEVGVGGELVPDAVELPMRLAVQRVQYLGPVDRDDADPAFVGDGAEAVTGHGSGPLRQDAGGGGDIICPASLFDLVVRGNGSLDRIAGSVC